MLKLEQIILIGLLKRRVHFNIIMGNQSSLNIQTKLAQEKTKRDLILRNTPVFQPDSNFKELVVSSSKAFANQFSRLKDKSEQVKKSKSVLSLNQRLNTKQLQSQNSQKIMSKIIANKSQQQQNLRWPNGNFDPARELVTVQDIVQHLNKQMYKLTKGVKFKSYSKQILKKYVQVLKTNGQILRQYVTNSLLAKTKEGELYYWTTRFQLIFIHIKQQRQIKAKADFQYSNFIKNKLALRNNQTGSEYKLLPMYLRIKIRVGFIFHPQDWQIFQQFQESLSDSGFNVVNCMNFNKLSVVNVIVFICWQKYLTKEQVKLLRYFVIGGKSLMILTKNQPYSYAANQILQKKVHFSGVFLNSFSYSQIVPKSDSRFSQCFDGTHPVSSGLTKMRQSSEYSEADILDKQQFKTFAWSKQGRSTIVYRDNCQSGAKIWVDCGDKKFIKRVSGQQYGISMHYFANVIMYLYNY